MDEPCSKNTEASQNSLMCLVCCQVLQTAKRPMIVVGSSCLQRKDGAAVHLAVSALANHLSTLTGAEKDWRVLNVLHRVSSSLAGSCVV